MQPICPYCNKPAFFTPGSEVYPHRHDLKFKWFWVCEPCDARVGCHPGGKPLGQLANAPLRRARMSAHNVFDQLWKRGGYTRSSAYRWLADQLGVKEVHIGQSDEDTCKRIIDVCKARKN